MFRDQPFPWKYVGFYLLFYTIGFVAIGGVGILAYAQPVVPPFFKFIFEQHVGVSFALSLLICPVVGGLTVAVIAAIIGLCLLAA